MASIKKIANAKGRGIGKHRYRVMWREDGKQRSRTFQDRLEAKDFALAIEKGESVVSRAHTFGELATRFLRDCDADVKASTRSRSTNRRWTTTCCQSGRTRNYPSSASRM